MKAMNLGGDFSSFVYSPLQKSRRASTPMER